MIEQIIQLHVTGEIKHSIYYLILFLFFYSCLCFGFGMSFVVVLVSLVVSSNGSSGGFGSDGRWWWNVW